MRLIDADALYDEIEYDALFSVQTAKDIVELIFSTPTVDAVEVVRCKDCFYSEPLSDCMKKQYGDNVVRCNHPHFGLNLMKKELFCCFGEHKDGD